MKDYLLWRKFARVILLLAERLDVSPERAMGIFYGTRTCRWLHDPEMQLHNMGDAYLVDDIIRELQDMQM